MNPPIPFRKRKPLCGHSREPIVIHLLVRVRYGLYASFCEYAPMVAGVESKRRQNRPPVREYVFLVPDLAEHIQSQSPGTQFQRLAKAGQRNQGPVFVFDSRKAPDGSERTIFAIPREGIVEAFAVKWMFSEWGSAELEGKG